MSGTMQAGIAATTLGLILVLFTSSTVAQGLGPNDTHVCTITETYLASVTVMYQAPYNQVYYTSCTNITSWFKCTQRRILYRSDYRIEVMTRTRDRYECCHGYGQVICGECQALRNSTVDGNCTQLSTATIPSSRPTLDKQWHVNKETTTTDVIDEGRSTMRNENDKSSNLMLFGTIFGAVIGCIVLIIIVLVSVWLFRKCQDLNKENVYPDDTPRNMTEELRPNKSAGASDEIVPISPYAESTIYNAADQPDEGSYSYANAADVTSGDNGRRHSATQLRETSLVDDQENDTINAIETNTYATRIEPNETAYINSKVIERRQGAGPRDKHGRGASKPSEYIEVIA